MNKKHSTFNVQRSTFPGHCRLAHHSTGTKQIGQRRCGMTLVETVLALAILSIGIFILVETTARCIAVVRQARNYQTARAVLDRGESEHPLRGTNSVDDNKVDPVDYDGYVYSRDLQPVEGEKKLFTVVTRVTWSERGSDSGEELVSYVYCPNEE